MLQIKPGDTVILIGLPPGFSEDLPTEDQQALFDVIGKVVRFRGRDEDGRCELEFNDHDGVTHVIYVHEEFISPKSS
jgi:hypothetical protein